MQPDMPLCQWRSSRKGTAISPIQIEELLAYYQHAKFAPLCRINYRSYSIEMFADLWSSLEVFDNFSYNKLSLSDVVLLKLQCLHRNRKCAKLMDISDFKTDWKSSVGYDQIGKSPKWRIKWFLFATYDDLRLHSASSVRIPNSIHNFRTLI